MANTNFNTLTFLRNYNNYFNRIIKQENSYSDYINNYEYVNINNINFSPNDGVATTQIVNWNELWMPDYLLILDSLSNILSRWFVLEAKRERNGQYRMSLKRDVIIDNYDTVLTAPCYIEKATVSENNPLIYNSEGIAFNQIKRSEYLLKDYTRSAWLVGYTARDYNENTSISVNFSRDTDFVWDADRFPIPGQEKIVNTFASNPTIEIIYFLDLWPINSRFGIDYHFDKDFKKITITTNVDETFGFTDNYFLSVSGSSNAESKFEHIANQMINNAAALGTSFKAQYSTYFEEESSILSYNGKTVYYQDPVSGDVKKYIIKVDMTSGTLEETIPNNSSVGVSIQNLYTSTSDIYEKTISGNPFTLSADVNKYVIRLIEYADASYTIPISPERNILTDAPYDMFCIPYSDYIQFKGDIGEGNVGTLFVNKSALSLSMAQGLVERLTNNVVYDLQLLPYCPIPNLNIEFQNDELSIINLTNLKENSDYSLITKSENNIDYPEGIIFWCHVSNGSFIIPYNYQVSNKKIENECDLWRLCSPNFNGMFDFSMAKNNGLDYFNVDWTYKPYTPYIHINPNFKNLYGGDYNDARGLICGGDFSVATAVSKFAEYEVQNKNYQNIFDRNIQNMETLHRYDVIQNSISGINQNAVAGFKGFTSGGVPGAIVGAAGHAIDHTTSMIMDAKRFRENKSYATDQFNLQIGNIQALPMSLTKSSALTYNNKIWPILEFYTATDVEKEALKNKLKYNGMTVMVIDEIRNYLQLEPSFIQGQMIRLENLNDDSHIAYAIYDEIKKGVYI